VSPIRNPLALAIGRFKQHLSHSVTETFELGRSLGQTLSSPTVICLFGDLATGKTTFIKGLVQGAAQLDPSIVQSPTFTYLNIYEGKQTIYHFDLYRLRDSEDFIGLGFDEYFEAYGICCIEWSERIMPILPFHSLHLFFTHTDQEEQRWITIKT
jgi:tRNA threonylcarbamoyladenosine biosynthesis protein TsaE